MPDVGKGAQATTLEALLRATAEFLDRNGVDEPWFDSRLLVEELTGTTRRDSVLDPRHEISAEAVEAVWRAMERRIAKEPPHRILGAREFYGLRLILSADTLEPRPDTEALVDVALEQARRIVSAKGACSVLDLGAGTGAVGLALLSEITAARATLTDISAEALATVMENAKALGLADRMDAVQADWFSGVTGRFDLIVSNPPYIPTRDIAGLQAEVRLFDPHRALDGGDDGLDCYRAIASGAAAHLAPDGHVAVEIGAGQRADVEAIFADARFRPLQVRRDLSGHERVLAFAPSAGEV